MNRKIDQSLHDLPPAVSPNQRDIAQKTWPG